jgi:hypothetical protein
MSALTVGLHLSGLNVTKSHPDMQKNPDKWIFLLTTGYNDKFEEGKNSKNRCFRLHIYLRTNKTLIYNSF